MATPAAPAPEADVQTAAPTIRPRRRYARWRPPTAASDVRRHNLLGRRQALAGEVLGAIGVALSIVVWIIAAASMS